MLPSEEFPACRDIETVEITKKQGLLVCIEPGS